MVNGPDLIAPELRRMPLNAIGNLRTDSPILRSLDEIPIDPDVPYHSIIPQIGGVLPTDGVVEPRRGERRRDERRRAREAVERERRSGADRRARERRTAT